MPGINESTQPESILDRTCDELIRRWRRGDRVPAEQLFHHWPDGRPTSDEVFELIYTEATLRDESGEPILEAMSGRFPEHSARLERQLALHRLLQLETSAEATFTGWETTLVDTQAQSGPQGEILSSMPEGYECRRRLGWGGMGVVYEVRQVRLNRVVALKMIRAGVHASPEARARFIAEAEVIARLRHPNIVQVYAFGESGGQPFFEMEYVDGGSLADRFNGIPSPPRDAANLVQRVARAIHEAHLKGVIHRDLKPSNILLMADGSPKIVDFGLAKLIDSDLNLTQTNSFLGSPAYMAPEQAGGRGVPIHRATDIHALGAILYELLTGRRVYVAETALETIELVRHAEPVPPSRLRPGLPRDLETICLRCLAKDPDRRYPTAEAMADDLGRWSRGESILARPAGLWRKSYRWSRRNRAVAGLIAAVVLLLVGGTTGMAVLWRRARSEATLASRSAIREAATNAELTRLSSELMLDRGLALADAGLASRGLPLMVQAAQVDAGNRAGFAEAARINLAAWSLQVPPTIRTVPLALRGNNLLSPDYRHVAAGLEDGSLALWDQQAGRVVYRCEPVPGTLFTGFAFSADSRVLAAYSNAGTIRFLEVPSGRPIASSLRVDTRYESMAFHPDGSLLAIVQGGLLRIWDIWAHCYTGEPAGFTDAVQDLKFSPDGSILVLAIRDGEVERRDGHTGRLLGPKISTIGPAWSVAFRPDGSRFAIGTGPYTGSRQARIEQSGVQVYETATGRPAGDRLRHEIGVTHLAYRNDGEVLVSADYDGSVRLWDRNSQSIGDPIKTDKAPFQLMLSPDGSMLMTQSSAGLAQIWDSETGRQIGATIDASGVGHFSFDPEGRRLTVFRAGQVETLDLSHIVTPCSAVTPPSKAMAFLPGDHAILAGGEGGVAQLTATSNGRSLGWPMIHMQPISAVAVSPDGSCLATGSHDATVRLWDDQGRLRFPPIPASHWITTLCFSPDGSRLLASDEAGAVRLIDTTIGRAIGPTIEHPLEFSGANADTLFFADRGRVGVSVGDSGTVARVDSATGKPLGDLWHFSRTVTSDHVAHQSGIAASPDGRTLALCDGRSIQVIDMATGRKRLPPLGKDVRAVAFVFGGKGIAGSCVDRMIRFWDAATGAPLGAPLPQPNPLGWQLRVDTFGQTLYTISENNLVRAWNLAARKPVGPSWVREDRYALPEPSPGGRFLAVSSRITEVYPLSAVNASPVESLLQQIPDQIGPTRGPTRNGVSPRLPVRPDFQEVDDWHLRVGTALTLRKNHVGALQHLDRYVRDQPQDWLGHAQRAEILSQLGRDGEARAEADRVHALADPIEADRWEAFRGLGAAAEGRWAEVITSLDRVLVYPRSPNRPLFHDVRGNARRLLGDWVGASADLSRGTWYDRSRVMDFLETGITALAAGDQEFYRRIVDRIIPPNIATIKQSPPRASILALLGSLGPAARANLDELVQLAEPAALAEPSDDPFEYRVRLGMALHRAGRSSEAIDRLTRTLHEHPTSDPSIALMFLAMAHERLGDHPRALSRLRQVPNEVVTLPLDGAIRDILIREATALILDPDWPVDPWEPTTTPPGP